MNLNVDYALVFKALGDATRLKIIEMLSCGELCACDILESFDITQPTIDKEAITVTYCNKGVTGNAAQNILLNHGFKEVYNLSGGHKNYSKTKKSL